MQPDSEVINPEEHTSTRGTRIFSAAPMLLLLTLVGGGVGLAVAIVGGLALESHAESTRPAGPVLSYGQQFGMIIIPICAIIGAAIGFSTAIALLRYRILAIILLLVTSFLGWGATSAMWNSQIKDYGPDPSEIVLYYPPTAMCFLALCAAGIILLSPIAITGFQRSQPTAT